MVEKSNPSAYLNVPSSVWHIGTHGLAYAARNVSTMRFSDDVASRRREVSTEGGPYRMIWRHASLNCEAVSCGVPTRRTKTNFVKNLCKKRSRRQAYIGTGFSIRNLPRGAREKPQEAID